MKITSQRTFMPEILYPGTGLSPLTDKSKVFVPNVPTIQDVLDGNKYKLPGGGGHWSEGKEDTPSFKEKGDMYKRDSQDLYKLMRAQKRAEDSKKEKGKRWKAKVQGGYRYFDSFEEAQRTLNGKFESLTRVAQISSTEDEEISNLLSNNFQNIVFIESTVGGSTNLGAGFFLSKNLICTCAHVIKTYDKHTGNNYYDWYGNKNIVVKTNNNQQFLAKVVFVNLAWDVAILQVNDYPTEGFELSLEANTGENVLSIGSPLGLDNHVSFGKIGSTNRKIYRGEGAPLHMFVDMTIFGGNSGGPVIRISDGKVVGMITAVVTNQDDAGLTMALPASYIEYAKNNIMV